MKKVAPYFYVLSVLIVKIVFNHPETAKSITRIAQKLQLFNLYCVRIILRIFLRDKIRNTILLTMAKTKAQIVIDRRIHFICHIFHLPEKRHVRIDFDWVQKWKTT